MDPSPLVGKPLFFQAADQLDNLQDVLAGLGLQVGRLKAIHKGLKESGVLELLVRLAPYPASLCWVERLHDPDYIRRFKEACEKGRTIFEVQDRGISKESYEIALLAVGGLLQASCMNLWG